MWVSVCVCVSKATVIHHMQEEAEVKPPQEDEEEEEMSRDVSGID